MYKTITELSKELSISRQAIHQVLDKLIDKKELSKKGNAFILNTEEQDIIRYYFNNEVEGRSSSKSSSESSSNFTMILQQQNEFLMRELENKNKQIDELHILLLKEKEKYQLTEGKEVIENKKEESKEVKSKKWYHIFKK